MKPGWLSKSTEALLFFAPDHYFFTCFFLNSQTSYLFHRNSIFELKGSKGLLKPVTKVSKPGGHSKVASVPFVFQLETRTVSH